MSKKILMLEDRADVGGVWFGRDVGNTIQVTLDFGDSIGQKESP